MSYTALPAKSPGDVLTSALWNTYLQGNADSGFMRKLGDTLVAGSSVASIDFSGIPATFGQLLLIVYAQSAAAGNDDLYVRLNADAGANYDFFGLRANNTTVVPNSAFANGAGFLIGQCPGANFNSRFSANALLLPNYAQATTRKSAKAEGGHATTAVGSSVYDAYNGFWNNVAAVNELTVRALGGNLVVGTRATLYGLPL